MIVNCIKFFFFFKSNNAADFNLSPLWDEFSALGKKGKHRPDFDTNLFTHIQKSFVEPLVDCTKNVEMQSKEATDASILIPLVNLCRLPCEENAQQ